jgi:hypothetical protein
MWWWVAVLAFTKRHRKTGALQVTACHHCRADMKWTLLALAIWAGAGGLVENGVRTGHWRSSARLAPAGDWSV